MTIRELLGIALGCVGLSLGDFCQLTPDELAEIVRQWRDRDTYAYRDRWEQARLIGQCALAPYSKKGVKATDIIRFAWDAEKKKMVQSVTRDDFERLRDLYG